MNDSWMTPEQFREDAAERLGYLESRGFRRIRSLEGETPMWASVVYLGAHVGFIFSLDVRDQCVDATVVRVVDGAVPSSADAGYRAGIFDHLVRYEGYRGGVAHRTRRTIETDARLRIHQYIDGWLETLQYGGEKLLRDHVDSLPS